MAPKDVAPEQGRTAPLSCGLPSHSNGWPPLDRQERPFCARPSSVFPATDTSPRRGGDRKGDGKACFDTVHHDAGAELRDVFFGKEIAAGKGFVVGHIAR